MKIFTIVVFSILATMVSADPVDIVQHFKPNQDVNSVSNWAKSVSLKNGISLIDTVGVQQEVTNEIHRDYLGIKSNSGFIIGQYRYQFSVKIDIIGDRGTISITLDRGNVVGIVMDDDIQKQFKQLLSSFLESVEERNQ